MNMEISPDIGLLLTTEEQLAHPPEILVGAPGMKLPVYGITKKDIPGVISFKSVTDLYKYLRDDIQAPVPSIAEAEGMDKVTAELDKIDSERLKEQAKCKKKYDKQQEGWKRPTDRPVRVFGYTTKFSSVMQYQMEGFLKGFEANGCETKFFQEKDAVSRTGYTSHLGYIGLPLQKALMEFKPDLIVSINWYRMAGIHGTVVPYYTWVQDRLRNLNEDFASQIKPNDFIGLLTNGWLDKWLMSKFPRSQMSIHPAGYDGTIFGPPDKPTERSGIVYIEQNGAKTPEQMFSELVNQYAGYTKSEPRLGQVFNQFFATIKGWFDLGVDLFEYEYECLWADITADMGLVLPSVFRRQFLWQFMHAVGTRWMRQRPLIELAMANAPLKLYGADWGKHPILGRFHAGPTPTLPELAKIYQSAQVVLGLQHESSMVHRVVEGLACGAHVAVKHLRTDFAQAASFVAVSQFAQPGEIVPLMDALLKTPVPAVTETNVLNFSMQKQAERILAGVNERMLQLGKDK